MQDGLVIIEHKANNKARKTKADPYGSRVVWRGVSMIDGKTPIMAVLTFKSDNEKLTAGGNATATAAQVIAQAQQPRIAQLWIFVEGQHPLDSIKSGQDAAICGNCPHRYSYDTNGQPLAGSRTCYVSTHGGMPSVWRGAYQKPVTAISDPILRAVLSVCFLRIGAYGDPAALPYELVNELAAIAGQKLPALRSKSVGYSHAWRTCDQRFRSLLMASCDTQEDVRSAVALGWRPFFAPLDGANVAAKSTKIADASLTLCLSANEREGATVACWQCGLCDGRKNDEDERNGIAIPTHGGTAVVANLGRKLSAFQGAPFPVEAPSSAKAKKTLPVIQPSQDRAFDIPQG